jgi:hypothetical protein
VLHDEDLAHAIVDRILERGRLLTLDGPSMRTRHLGLDDPTANLASTQSASLSGDGARISGIQRPEFPEPTALLPFIAAWLPDPPSTRLSRVVRVLTPTDPGLFALPDIARIWLDAYVNNAGYFVLFAIALFVCIKAGARLERSAQDRARVAWEVPTGNSSHGSTARVSWTQWLRTNDYYQRGSQFLKWTLFPDWIIGPAVIYAALWLVLLMYCQTALEIAENSQSLCHATGTRTEVMSAQRIFGTQDLCGESWGLVDRGRRYLVTFDVIAPWADGGIAASPIGLDRGDLPFLLGYLTTPLLRVPDARFLQPVLKIVGPYRRGGVPEGVYLEPLFLQRSSQSASLYSAEFIPTRSGELFIFPTTS